MSLDEVTDAAEPKWRAKVRGSRLGNVLVLLVTALAVLVGAWLVTPRAADDDAGEVSRVDVAGAATQPRVGEPAPGFSATTLTGDEVSLDELRGRPVWLVFVATWCSGCRAEMPDVQAAHEAADADGVQVVAVYVGEPASTVGPYADRLGLTFTQVPDAQSRLAAAYGVLGVPAHFFIDSAGVVQETRVGVLSPTQMVQAIAKASA